MPCYRLRYIDHAGLQRVCGGADLKASQYYPKLFGHCVAQCFEKQLSEIKEAVKSRAHFDCMWCMGHMEQFNPEEQPAQQLVPRQSLGKLRKPPKSMKDWISYTSLDYIYIYIYIHTSQWSGESSIGPQCGCETCMFLHPTPTQVGVHTALQSAQDGKWAEAANLLQVMQALRG